MMPSNPETKNPGNRGATGILCSPEGEILATVGQASYFGAATQQR